MKLTNKEIYNYANQLAEFFSDTTQKLPIKINFYLQKNKNTLLDLAANIEDARIELAKSNGHLDPEKGQYVIDQDKIDMVYQELADLFDLEQEVNIYTISIDSLSDDLTLTTGQMEALMFMID